MRTHYCGEPNRNHLQQTVTLCGWAHRRRDHGGVIFIDLRDREGLVQIVCDPDRAETFATAEKIRNEFVLKITGLVRNHPEALIDLLEIPRYVFPVCGLVVGHPANLSALKPRLPQAAVFHREKYQPDLKPLIEEYDPQLAAHMSAATKGRLTKTWSQTVAEFYDHSYAPNVHAALDRKSVV